MEGGKLLTNPTPVIYIPASMGSTCIIREQIFILGESRQCIISVVDYNIPEIIIIMIGL